MTRGSISSLTLPKYHSPGEVSVVGVVVDYLSHFVSTIIPPLLPQFLVEHRWSKDYDCTDQFVCALYITPLHYLQENLFYCDFGLGGIDRCFSGWYTHFELIGNCFTLSFGPWSMRPPDAA